MWTPLCGRPESHSTIANPPKRCPWIGTCTKNGDQLTLAYRPVNQWIAFGLAFAGAIMLATLAIAFNSLAQSSTVLTPAQQEMVVAALEEDAQIMSDTQLTEQLAGQPDDVQAEILRINSEARTLALQVAIWWCRCPLVCSVF